MIKSKSEMFTPPTREIDLTGPQGNAYFLLGMARSYAEQIWPTTKEERDEWKKNSEVLDLLEVEKPKFMTKADEICEEMKQGDYEHLISTFDKYFGKIVTLYR